MDPNGVSSFEDELMHEAPDDNDLLSEEADDALSVLDAADEDSKETEEAKPEDDFSDLTADGNKTTKSVDDTGKVDSKTGEWMPVSKHIRKVERVKAQARIDAERAQALTTEVQELKSKLDSHLAKPSPLAQFAEENPDATEDQVPVSVKVAEQQYQRQLARLESQHESTSAKAQPSQTQGVSPTRVADVQADPQVKLMSNIALGYMTEQEQQDLIAVIKAPDMELDEAIHYCRSVCRRAIATNADPATKSAVAAALKAFPVSSPSKKRTTKRTRTVETDADGSDETFEAPSSVFEDAGL